MPVLLSGGYLVPVDVVEREHARGVVRVDLERERVAPGAQPAGQVERVARVVALEGRVRGELVAVDPQVGLTDDAVDHQLLVLARLEVRFEFGPKPPRHGELGDGVGPDRFDVAEAVLHRFGEEHVRAGAVLQQRVYLGSDRACIVGLDRQPRAGGEAGFGDLVAGLGRERAALHLPAAESERDRFSRGARDERRDARAQRDGQRQRERGGDAPAARPCARTPLRSMRHMRKATVKRPRAAALGAGRLTRARASPARAGARPRGAPTPRRPRRPARTGAPARPGPRARGCRDARARGARRRRCFRRAPRR